MDRQTFVDEIYRLRNKLGLKVVTHDCYEYRIKQTGNPGWIVRLDDGILNTGLVAYKLEEEIDDIDILSNRLYDYLTMGQGYCPEELSVEL